MKRKIFLKWFILLVAISINLFIFINSFINGETSAKESATISEFVADVVNTIKPETVNTSNFETFSLFIRKSLGHFILFLCSGIFTTLTFFMFLKKTKFELFIWEFVFASLSGILLALLSEFIQIFINGRSGAFLDVLIDCSGYFIAEISVFLIVLLKKDLPFLKQKKI